jgi:threonine/homoserine/homoserine lactone efflux protein
MEVAGLSQELSSRVLDKGPFFGHQYKDMLIYGFSYVIGLVDNMAFFLAAIMLLGSPGPGIAALIAVGKDRGFVDGLRFYWGLQAGLALAAAVSAGGLFSLIRAVPAVMAVLTAIAVAYLCWLACKIATAPVGAASDEKAWRTASTAWSGFLLGIANPKAYLAFVSLMASHAIVHSSVFADAGLKWLLCVIVMIVVDIAWLAFGAIVGMAVVKPGAERALNLVTGGAILTTTLLALV